MTESYLTTDIIVIIVLVVVLILVGACAFFAHFYWTKIGIAEIWNTAKWSSMRSSVYQTFRRFSLSSAKSENERPFSAASVYSVDSDGGALPAPLRNKNPTISSNPKVNSSHSQSRSITAASKSSNQVQPVSTTKIHNIPVNTDYESKGIASPSTNRIHRVQVYGDSVDTEKNRF